jgi:hypothetical protein
VKVAWVTRPAVLPNPAAAAERETSVGKFMIDDVTIGDKLPVPLTSSEADT